MSDKSPRFVGESGGMLPQNILKSGGSEMAFSTFSMRNFFRKLNLDKVYKWQVLLVLTVILWRFWRFCKLDSYFSAFHIFRRWNTSLCFYTSLECGKEAHPGKMLKTHNFIRGKPDLFPFLSLFFIALHMCLILLWFKLLSNWNPLCHHAVQVCNSGWPMKHVFRGDQQNTCCSLWPSLLDFVQF